MLAFLIIWQNLTSPRHRPLNGLQESATYKCCIISSIIINSFQFVMFTKFFSSPYQTGIGFKMAPLAGKVLGEMATGKPPSFDTSLLGIDNFLPGQKSKLRSTAHNYKIGDWTLLIITQNNC